MRRPSLVFAALLAFLLVAAWFVYRPGLTGAFLFDDFANLPALGAYGPVDEATTFWRYVSSGTADPTGRPLALLSFLLDANNWPADPAPFKRTNVLLHLLIGAALGWLLLQLGRVLVRDERQAALAALFGCALWLVHPLFVSTVLYVVQREAMLPALFVLVGIIGYLHARSLTTNGSRAGPFLAAGAIGLSALLAVSSKGNGILLPLLAWLVEVIVIAPRDRIDDERVRRRLTLTRRLVLELPSALVLAWFAWTGFGYATRGVPDFRPWTFAERLLTEGRVVCDYLGLLFLPRPYTAGLFNDAIAPSTGLFAPPTTFVALLFLAGLIVLAVRVRRRAPAVSLAILFFFVGHLLESTVIPLELYYEHRNYLPAMLMFWPIGLWASDAGAFTFLRRALLVVAPLLLAALTWMGTDLWGNAEQQALVWAAKNADSPRAQAYAAQFERVRGRPQAAIQRLRNMPANEARDVQVVLNLLGAECEAGGLAPADIELGEASLRSARITGQLGYAWFGDAIDRLRAGQACPGLGADEIRRLLDAAAANPYGRSYGRVQDNMNLRARLALALDQPAEALEYFNRSLEAKPLPAVALQQAALLGAAGHPGEALRHLDRLEQLWTPTPPSGWSMQAFHERMLQSQGYWTNEISTLRAALRAAPEHGSGP